MKIFLDNPLLSDKDQTSFLKVHAKIGDSYIFYSPNVCDYCKIRKINDSKKGNCWIHTFYDPCLKTWI